MNTILFSACLSQILKRQNPFCTMEVRDDKEVTIFRFEVQQEIYTDRRNLFLDSEAEFPEWDAITFYCYDGGTFHSAELAALWAASFDLSLEDKLALTKSLKVLDNKVYLPLGEVRERLKGVAAA